MVSAHKMGPCSVRPVWTTGQVIHAVMREVLLAALVSFRGSDRYKKLLAAPNGADTTSTIVFCPASADGSGLVR